MEARYYNGNTGKFISQDLAFWNSSRIQTQLVDPQSWNSYAYGRNNPIKHNDPDGQFWDTVVDIGLTAWDGSRFLQHSGTWLGDQASIGLGKLTGNQKLENNGRRGAVESGTALKSVSVELGIDIAATAIPGVPAFVGKVDNVAKLANKTSDAGKYVDNVDDIIPPARQSHILYGDKTGGGHLSGASVGKSEFPANWTPKQIFHNGADIATDPKANWIWQPKHQTYRINGVRDGVNMTSIVDKTKSFIKTIFPKSKK